MNKLDLGTRLRALRSERGLSLSQLEAATSISSSFLSLVESGKSDITISRLVRLADFFDVELSDLVEGSRVERRPFEVIRDGEGSVLTSTAEGLTTRFLGLQRWQLSPRVTDYEAGATLDIAGGEGVAREIFHHRELFIYVINGTFEVTVRGDSVEVSRGDALLIRDGADRVVNAGRRPGRLLIVGVTLGS
ncbi:MAG TPA: helix-turn-helix domain-containing protein [Solirubrobacterales bacterium]|jgi:transcriptional regulator with XRE-family HTH domain|nr:helix-turn-helix domain-containing protein [Solirubrobacterales bacterium]